MARNTWYFASAAIEGWQRDKTEPLCLDKVYKEENVRTAETPYPRNFTAYFRDGSEFIKLTKAEVKEMVPPLGLAKKIIRMIPKVCPTMPNSIFEIPM